MTNAEILLNAAVGTRFNVLEDDGTIDNVEDVVVRTEKGYRFEGPGAWADTEFPEEVIPRVWNCIPDDSLVVAVSA